MPQAAINILPSKTRNRAIPSVIIAHASRATHFLRLPPRPIPTPARLHRQLQISPAALPAYCRSPRPAAVPIRFGSAPAIILNASTTSRQPRIPGLAAKPVRPLEAGACFQMWRTSTISYSITPPGVFTATTSPSSLAIKARASGDPTEIFPSLKSASSSPTIW